MKHASRSLCIVHCAFCISALVANAADIYVSHIVDGGGAPYYAGAPAGAVVKGDLQEAVDLAAAGDTVWVEDGFVCDSGSRHVSGSVGCYRIYAPNRITLRSRSGEYTTGVTVRGAFHSDSTPCGSNAIKGIYLQANSVLFGFRVENAATCNATTQGNWSGNNGGDTRYARSGAGISVGEGSVVSNCLVSGCRAYEYGGAAYAANKKANFVNCVFSGNSAATGGGAYGKSTFIGCQFLDNDAGKGGGLYGTGNTLKGCLFHGNSATSGYGGGIYGNAATSISNCVFRGNSATASTALGGALYFYAASSIIDCEFHDNVSGNNGGAVYGPCTLNRCLLEGNSAIYGGAVYGKNNITLTNCVVRGNRCSKTGGGVCGATLRDCLVEGNATTNLNASADNKSGVGGGLYDVSAYDCVICGNDAYANNTRGGKGGGAANSKLYRCVITNNTASYAGGGIHNYSMDSGLSYNCLVSDNTAATIGGGIYSGYHYNDLVTDNVCADAAGGAVYDTVVINCTVADNRCNGAAKSVRSVNSVFCGNGSSEGAFGSTTNSCVKGLAAITSKGPGNTSADPRLGTEGAMRYLPLPRSPCINKGVAFEWMTAGIRSLAYNGRRRIVGAAPDIGALEAPFWPTIVEVR